MTRPVITIPLKCNTARKFYHFLKGIMWIELPILFISSIGLFLQIGDPPSDFGGNVLGVMIFSGIGTIVDFIINIDGIFNFVNMIIDHIPRLECIKTDDDNGKDL